MTLNRYGEDAKETGPVTRPHHADCKGGWLGQDLNDHPIPCIQCKPHLATRRLPGGRTA